MKLVELMCCLLAVLVHPCYTVDWYISVDRGSSDVNECGLSMGSPCSSIELILANISSTVITSDGTLCYQETTGSLFTSFYFLSGRYTLVPFCLMGWSNLVISGAEDASFDSNIGPNRGVIEIRNSTNISIANITFISSIVGRATLYVKDSTQVYISNGIFPVYAIGSNGIAFSNVYGTVVISHTVFKGNFFLTSWLDMEPASALRINQGFDILDSNFVPEVDIKPFDIEITNCTFERLGSSNDYRYTNSLNNYESTSSSATALLLQYTHSSINNRIVIEDSNFVKNVRLDGSVSIIRYSHDAYNNSAIFRNCRFENNKARYGGGIATYFIGSAEQNSLHVENCSFYRNEATFEGGGIFASSLVLKADSRIIVKGCEFVDNKALYGAGVFVFNDPNWSISNFTFISSSTRRLIPVHLTDCHFINCSCSFSEGVINVLKSHFSLKGSNLFTGNYGSSVVLRSSIMVANGNTLFSRNKATHGGGLKILLNSLVDFLYVENFTFSSNTAMSFGGAVYADSSSTTVTADVYNHSLAAGSLGNCFILFPSSKESLIYFINNTAVISGNDFHVFNLRSCSQGYFIPNPLQMCFPNVQNNPVAIETDTPFLSTSTGPSYLYFYGSSTGCYKPVGDIIYKLPNCTSDILKDTFFGLSQLVCGVEAIKQNELSLLAGPGGALTPPPNNLVLPWAGIGISWTANPGNERSQCIEQVPSNLILSPSPGEAFGLTIQLADQLLNFITGTVFIQVNSNGVEPPGVLLQLNGLQYAYTDRIYFTPNRPLTGLALVGLPGTSGHLNIVSESQILGEAIVLQIPFILSQCPLGYFDPPGATNIDEVNELILTNFSFTQRAPSNHPLACQCYTMTTIRYRTDNFFLNEQCIFGYTVQINGELWAGLIPINGSTPSPDLPTVSCYNTSSYSDFRKSTCEEAHPNFAPVKVSIFEDLIKLGGGAPVLCYNNYTVEELVDFKRNAFFSVDYCLRGFCQGDSQTSWFLSDVDYPCVAHRQGILCGQCKPSYSQTMTSTECKDCSNPRWYIPLLSTIVIGLLLVVFVIALNIGVTPTVDSLLFFVQTVVIITAGRSEYSNFTISLAFFNLDFTFNQCITSDLSAVARLLMQYATPLYIMLLLSVVLALTKIKGFAKLLGNHSILHALWLLILVSYLNLAATTFEIFHCHYIGPLNNLAKWVLVYDAEIQCWQGSHLIWGLLSVVFATFVILPFPLYVLLAIRYPKIKPITDVYTGIYKDSQRYWVVWNLLRRIVMVIISVFVVQFIYRHFSLFLASLVILAVFALTRPYKCKLDNCYGGLVSISVVLFCGFSQPVANFYFDPNQASSWTLVSLMIAIGVFFIVIEWILVIVKKKYGTDYTKDDVFFVLLKDKLVRLKEVILKNKNDNVATKAVSRVFMDYREPLIDSVSYTATRHQLSFSNDNENLVTELVLSGSEPTLNVPINVTSTVVSVLSDSTD